VSSDPLSSDPPLHAESARPPSTSMEPIVEMRNVGAWRGRTRVFDSLTLSLYRGRNTAILGPNGAGKSTLLQLLSREIHPEYRETGSMTLFGQARWNVWELRSRLGIVSHDLQQEYPRHASGGDVVLSGFHSSLGVWSHQRYTDGDRAKARSVLAQLGIDHLADRRYATLSTGEQRRFLLARALVHDPEVLILDEPTSGLDPRACFHYIDLIREWMRSGKTLVLVTHHIHEIPPEVDHVILLADGEVLAEGPKKELLSDRWLSRTFGTPIRVLEGNGFHQAVPASGLSEAHRENRPDHHPPSSSSLSS